MTAGTVIEALSDPTRRQIVTLLSGGPKRAGELAAEVGMSAPAMSRHLRVLLSALVIADERLDEDARARVFRLRPESIKAVQAWLDQLIAGGPTRARSRTTRPHECDLGRRRHRQPLNRSLALTVWSVRICVPFRRRH